MSTERIQKARKNFPFTPPNLFRYAKTVIIFGMIAAASGSNFAFARGVTPEMLYGREKDLQTRIIIQIFLKSNHIRSLDDYAHWLSKNIRYKTDEYGDQWARPEETLRNGFGDCEDIAFLNQAVLLALGYQPHVVAFARQGYAHAFCIFKLDRVYAVFDNTHFVITRTGSLNEIVNFVHTQENAKLFMELSLNPSEVKMFYFRT